MVERYRGGALQRKFAEAYRVERRTVAAIVARQGAERKRGLDEAGIVEAITRYESGQSLAAVGRHLGVDSNTVRARLIEHGVAMRDTHGRAMADGSDC